MKKRDVIERFWSKVDASDDDGCWLWLASRDQKGYGKFSFNGRRENAHRVSWILANGEIPKGAYVLHKCDNPSCVRPDHLFLGTQKDNLQDCISKGRFKYVNPPGLPSSRPSPMQKLTVDEVKEIRRIREAGELGIRPTARRFGVDPATVRMILQRKTWRHVD